MTPILRAAVGLGALNHVKGWGAARLAGFAVSASQRPAKFRLWLAAFTVASFAAFAASAEPFVAGPVTQAVQVSGVPVTLSATVSVDLQTFADRADAAIVLSVDLSDLERQTVPLARAAGLTREACQNGATFDVTIDRGELVPASPAILLRLHGKVRAWLCKPFKTHLSPELDVTAETVLRAAEADGSVRLTATDTRISTPDLGRLGPARGAGEVLLRDLAAQAERDLNRELAGKAISIAEAIKPLRLDALEAGFSEKALAARMKIRASASDAAALLTRLLAWAQAK